MSKCPVWTSKVQTIYGERGLGHVCGSYIIEVFSDEN